MRSESVNCVYNEMANYTARKAVTYFLLSEDLCVKSYRQPPRKLWRTMMKILNHAPLTSTCLILLCILSNPANAAGNDTGVLTIVYSHPSASLFGIGTEPVTGTPACNTTNQFAASNATEHGKRTFALLLAAKLANKPVTIIGTGACALLATREDISYVYMQ
jgi:hypothetical protein